MLYDLQAVLKASTKTILKAAAEELRKTHEKVYETHYYTYAIGEVPMCLVAHADTVRADSGPMDLDVTPWAIRNKNGILGADDRAGIFAIFQILKTAPAKPSVLITNYEESGCRGAVRWLLDGVWSTKDVLFIELDRRGSSHYVTYNGTLPKEVADYIESFGFRRENGTVSDIMYITEEYGVPSVNLSIGFHNEHSHREILILDEMWATIRKVRAMVAVPLMKLYRIETTEDYFSDDLLYDERPWWAYDLFKLSKPKKDEFREVRRRRRRDGKWSDGLTTF